MAIKAVLFDLDGTLLPMDLDDFIKRYFSLLAAKLATHGYDPEQLVEEVWRGTMAMIKGDGTRTNEQVFWESMVHSLGEGIRADETAFEEFYLGEFQTIRSICGYTPVSRQLVRTIKSAGYSVVLATNPVFPAIATESRIRWAGLDPEDFVFYTTYENSSWCKPRAEYYKEVIDRLGVAPEECLMVGNDVDDDMPAAKLGMQVYLATDCLINKRNVDISVFPHGPLSGVAEYLGLSLDGE